MKGPYKVRPNPVPVLIEFPKPLKRTEGRIWNLAVRCRVPRRTVEDISRFQLFHKDLNKEH